MAQKGKRFFFEKKNQKTFVPGRALSAASNSDSDPSVPPSLRSLSKEQAKSAKVFCFFFSKKKCFLKSVAQDNYASRGML